FFQAEDGIRDRTVTGVQTCALPIYDAFSRLGTGPLGRLSGPPSAQQLDRLVDIAVGLAQRLAAIEDPGSRAVPKRLDLAGSDLRSEERRVGKECRFRGGRQPE